MLVSKSDFGQIIWITEEEMYSEALKREIERLKGMGRVAVFCSGGEKPKLIIEKLVSNNLKTMSFR